jgi:hypothetical protein
MFTLCIYVFPFIVHPPGFLKDVGRIQKGMPASEVEAILGKPTFMIPNDPAHMPPGCSLDYELADGAASISYDGDGRVTGIVYVNDNERRFWQSIKWLLRE